MQQKVLKVKFEDLSKTRTPILSYCRKLIEDKEDPETRLEIYRFRKTPDVIVPSIGRAALQTVQEDRRVGPRFVKYREYEG